MCTAHQATRLALNLYMVLAQRTYAVRGQTSLPAGPKIIAMNHTPGCDPLYLPFVLEETPHFLLQDGLFALPGIGQLLRELGQIPVRRGTERARDAKEQACALVWAGKTIAIFPEGKDVPSGKRIPAKTGAVRIALETGAPIIPLGLYAHPQRLTILNFNWGGHRRSGAWQFTGQSYMFFGAAWRPSTQANIHSQTEELMDRIYALVAEAERESLCALPTSLSPILP